jgi:hypothetical protein
MGWFSTNKERERYYLLPGMGGRALKAKQRTMLWWGIAVGGAIAGAFAAILYFLQSRGTGI